MCKFHAVGYDIELPCRDMPGHTREHVTQHLTLLARSMQTATTSNKLANAGNADKITELIASNTRELQTQSTISQLQDRLNE